MFCESNFEARVCKKSTLQSAAGHNAQYKGETNEPQCGMKMQKALKVSESLDNNIFHPRRLGALVQAQNDGKGEKVMKKETRALHFSH